MFWEPESWRQYTGCEAGYFFKKSVEKYEKSRNVVKKPKDRSKKTKIKVVKSKENDYGINAEQAALTAEEYQSEYERLINSLQVYKNLFIPNK